MGAGVKMVDIQKPVYTEIPDSSMAVPGNIALIYGGRKDD
jgi:hypothetical protein